MDLVSILTNVLFVAPPLLTAVICHEVAHGWVAEKLGDPTARRLGRITLNPIVHIDLWMTILFPAMLIAIGSPVIFGGAKPVPVNPLNFKNPRRGMAYVAVAGPLVNFTFVALLLPVFKYLDTLGPQEGFLMTLVGVWVVHGILINLVLGLFNLLPVPPLDGGRIAVGFLPVFLARPLARLEPYGLLIVIMLLATGTVASILDPIVSYFALKILPVP